jgi:Na+/H+-dicarboxylate symporter
LWLQEILPLRGAAPQKGCGWRLQMPWFRRRTSARVGDIMSGRFTQFIIGAMLLGIITGTGAHHSLPPEGAKIVAGYFSVITDVFLRLIKMIIAPLVFTTLVAGIANMGRKSEDGASASLGRIGARTLGWFLSASLVSLLLGLIMFNLLRPKGSICPCPTATKPWP